MKMKKILALLLSFMLVLGSVPVAMAADGMTVTVEASDKEVAPGDVVTFDVELTDAEDIRGIELRLKVSDGLTVESFEKADAPDGWFTSVNDKTLGLAYAGAAGDEFSGDITLATLTCTVDDDAAGDLYVSITTCKIADINNEPADFETVDAELSIHEHEFDWNWDDDYHWLECDCDEIKDKAEHEWTLIDSEDSSCAKAGYEKYECECGATKTVDLDKAEHEYEWVVTKEATCTEEGEETQVCKHCDAEGATRAIPALGHDWNSDLICNTCGEEMRVDDNTDVTVKEDGTIIITKTLEDGTVVKTYKYTTGVQVTLTISSEGEVLSIVINIVARVSTEAVRTDIPVELCLDEIEELKEEYIGTNLLVTIVTNCEDPVPVEFPVEGVKPGHVVVVVDADGNQTVVAGTKMTENGLVFYCENGVTIKVIYNAKTFADIKGNNWYNNAVDFVSARGIMTGMTANTFEPAGTTTRAQVWTMLARLAGVDTTCTEGNWYDVARAWAMENGISDGTNANGNITRQELVTMLYRFAGQQGESKSIATFSDAANVAGWAKAAMEWAYGMGVMNGNADGTLNPTGNATRAEMAQFFMNFIQNV